MQNVYRCLKKYKNIYKCRNDCKCASTPLFFTIFSINITVLKGEPK